MIKSNIISNIREQDKNRYGNSLRQDMLLEMIENISVKNMEEVQAFLRRSEESAQFLINNMRLHGCEITDHPNSGNFKLIRKNGKVVSVFCLTRRGNLLVQSEDLIDSESILDVCANEAIALRGFIGDWDSVEPVYKLFKMKNPNFRPSYESKEILYSYELSSSDSKIKFDPRVRRLEISDFSQWAEFTIAYLAELSLPDGVSEEQKRKSFESQVANKTLWGLFDGDSLLSTAGLNSSGARIGQVGGVFTPKKFRQKGFSKAVMFHLLKDCRDLHHHQKSILFTGSGDNPAQKLYESMGYQRIGSFALIV